MEEQTKNSEEAKTASIPGIELTIPEGLQEFTEASGSTCCVLVGNSIPTKKNTFNAGKLSFSSTTKGVTLFPGNGLYLMRNKSFTPSPSLQTLISQQEKRGELAFTVLKTKTGGTQYISTLSEPETQFAVALLAEFVAQSQPNLSDTCNANKAIYEENKKRRKKRRNEEMKKERNEETVAQSKLEKMAYQTSLSFKDLPFQEAKIGQTEDRVPTDIKDYMRKRYGVIIRDLWLDEEGKSSFDPCFSEEPFRILQGFKRDGKSYYIEEQVPNVYETYICSSYLNVGKENEIKEESIKIHKRRADKVIFLTRAEFCMKYFKANTKSYLYKNFPKLINTLGTKRIPVFSEDGENSTSQFFTVYEDFCSSDGKNYIMLKLESPDIMDGIDRNNYVKFQENFENLLSQGKGVLLALWAYCVEIRKRDYKKTSLKGVSKQILTLQELFERTARANEIEESRFKRYLCKLKEALLSLQKEKIIIAWRISGKGEKNILKSELIDKIQIDIDLNFTKRKSLAELSK